jgi:hypothetical protein
MRQRRAPTDPSVDTARLPRCCSSEQARGRASAEQNSSRRPVLTSVGSRSCAASRRRHRNSRECRADCLETCARRQRLVGLFRTTILARCFLRSGRGCLRLGRGLRDAPLLVQLRRGWSRVAGGRRVRFRDVPFRADGWRRVSRNRRRGYLLLRHRRLRCRDVAALWAPVLRLRPAALAPLVEVPRLRSLAPRR